ncbi:MAG: hypothetical protein R3298_12675 [Gammaproteobacteria bacterium]|nr:hypothetical protein [Gammaproteobacteria bacterium]
MNQATLTRRQMILAALVERALARQLDPPHAGEGGSPPRRQAASETAYGSGRGRRGDPLHGRAA